MSKLSKDQLEARRKFLVKVLEDLNRRRDEFLSWKGMEEKKIVRAKERAKVLKDDVAEVDAEYRATLEELNDVNADLNAMDSKVERNFYRVGSYENPFSMCASKMANIAILYGANHMGDVFTKGAFSQSLNRMTERLKPLTKRVRLDFNPNSTDWLKAWLDAGVVDPEKKLAEKEERKPDVYQAIKDALKKVEPIDFPKPLFLYAPDPDTKPNNLDALRALLNTKGDDEALRVFFGMDFGHADESVTVEVSQEDGVLSFRVLDKMKDAPEEEDAKVKNTPRAKKIAAARVLFTEGLGILEKIAGVRHNEIKNAFKWFGVSSLKELCDVNREGFSLGQVESILHYLRGLETDISKELKAANERLEEQRGRVKLLIAPAGEFVTVDGFEGVTFAVNALEVFRKAYTGNTYEVKVRLEMKFGGIVEETKLFTDYKVGKAATEGKRRLLLYKPITDFVLDVARHAADRLKR